MIRRRCARKVLRACLAAAAFLSGGAASAQLLVSKSFTPANVAPADPSVLTIQVVNNTTTTATSVSVTDQLPTTPTGLVIASGGLLSNSCGGTVTAAAGATKVTLTGGTVAAASGGNAGSCAISVQVAATPAANASSTNYTNTIPTANVTSSIGGSSSAVSATISVAPVLSLTGSITFTPTVLKGDGASARMRITISNPNSYPVTSTAFTNTLATTLAVSPTANPTTTCTGGTVGGGATAVTLTGATIAAGGSCYVETDIVARTPAAATTGSVGNSIVLRNVTTDQKITNAAAISGSVTVQTGAAVAKSFNSATVGVGQNSTLTITITNYRVSALGPFSLTDTLPSGLNIAGSGATTCAGGSVSTASGTITLNGGTLAAAPDGATGGTSCTISVPVSSLANGSYVNTIPAGTVGGSSFNAASATLLVSAVRGVKAFSPATVALTGASTLTIKLYNRNTLSAASITAFSDDLTTLGSGFVVASGTAATTGCGGTITATAGSTLITQNGGAIPIAPNSTTEGTCSIVVPVQVSNNAAIATNTNTVPANGLQTPNGNNTVAFTATLKTVAPLTVALAFSPTTVAGNATTTITVTLTRAAYAAFFTGLAVTDTLPSGFTIAATPNASTTCSGATLTASAGATSVSLSGGASGSTLSAASSCTVSVDVLAPATAGTYTNTIAVGGATASTTQGSVASVTAASATVTVVAGVSVNTAFSPTSTTVGGTSRLSDYISSPASIGALSGVTFTDTLPSGLVVNSTANASFTASSGTCTGTITATPGSNVVKVTGGSISAGALCQLSFDVTPNSVGTLTHTVAAGALTSSQGYTNANSASASLSSSGSADIGITNSDGATQIIAGATTTYTLVVTNNSPSISVAGLPVLDPDQSGLTIQSWTCTATSGSSCLAASGTGALNSKVSLAGSGQATYQVTARLDSAYASAQATNTASINPGGAGISEANLSNDSASDVDNVVRSADLSVTKTMSPSSPRYGDTVTFVVTATNTGPSDAAGVAVTDSVPSGYTVQSVTPADGSWSAPTWTVGPLVASGSSTLTIVATVNRTGGQTNTATITSSTTDPVSSNNSASVTPSIVGLAVTKTSSVLSDPFNGTASPKAIPGSFIQYRITISNETSTAIDANTIVITDTLPTQLSPYVLSPAVTMTEGSPASGLTFSPTGDVAWSNQAGGGPPYTYAPVADASGCDPLVTGLKISTHGSIAAGTSTSPTSATFTLKAKIK